MGALSDVYKTSGHILAGASFVMSEDDISALQESTQLRFNTPALDECLYDLTDEERSYFKKQTGIQDDDELKAHILQVQAEAYKVCDREEISCTNLMPGLSKNRLFLTLASACSISQSKYPKKKKDRGSRY